ncbi:Thg1 C terminal domain-containing protein [Russula dissimulans]|nr:Thg1 C terminal domain-containing protein [Russula dissimulans]
MANSRYAYVRDFELPDSLLPGTFILVRVDGHAFQKFTDVHGFVKPNDVRGLELMDHAAISLMEQHPDIMLAFGQSDEYSFLFPKTAKLYNRRRSKITSLLCSLFTASYMMNWPKYFPTTPLRYPPSFDARIVLYPGIQEVRDYFSWRQVDTHVNNLYNTTFWALVHQEGQSPRDAHETLRTTVSHQKQEMLFQRFNINYNAVPSRYRKGSVLVREPVLNLDGDETEGKKTSVRDVARTSHALVGPESELVSPKLREKYRTKHEAMRIALLHCDIIGDEFWKHRPYLWVEMEG